MVHRCDDDSGGFEYEYCFAEYDTNRKTRPRASLLVPYAVRKKMRMFPHLIHRHLFLPWEEKVVFVLVHVLNVMVLVLENR